MRKPIPYSRQNVTEEDVEAVAQILRSDWLTTGPAITNFESALKEYTGAPFAFAVSNATTGLHLACLAVGLKPGEELWTSPNSFVASANCGIYCGAKVDFVDIDPKTYNLSISALREKLKSGSRPKVLVTVDFSGQTGDLKEIAQLGREYGFKVLQDASHSIGGRYLDERVGACNYSDATIFSLHAVKVLTTGGEGGVVLTRDPQIAHKLQRLRSHGITRDDKEFIGPKQGGWDYQMIDLGYNYRMTDAQAAMGLSQLKRIESLVQRRHRLADTYDRELSGLPLTLPVRLKDRVSGLHLYVLRVHQNRRKSLYDFLHSNGILANVHYIPIHTQPYYQELGFRLGQFPEAEAYYQEALSIPLYVGLSDEEQQYVIDTIKGFFK